MEWYYFVVFKIVSIVFASEIHRVRCICYAYSMLCYRRIMIMVKSRKNYMASPGIDISSLFVCLDNPME